MRLWLIFTCLAPGSAWAHEGEEHGILEHARESALATADATGEHFEVVVKAHAGARSTELLAFVADADSNEPVQHAELHLSVIGERELELRLSSAGSPGVYTATVTGVLWEHELVARVSHRTGTDLLSLGELHAPEGEPEPARAQPQATGLYLLAAVLVASVILLVSRRGRSAAGLLLLLLPPAARAHEGEVHGAPARKVVSQGAGIYLAKEAQFLFEVRTELAAVRPMKERITVPARVVPRTDHQAQVFAPFAGTIEAEGGRIPLVGERVKKGQVLAVVHQSLSTVEAAQLAAERIGAQSAEAQAQAALEQARRDLERVHGLAGVVAEKDRQRAELAVRLAEQDLLKAERQRALYAASGGQGKLMHQPLLAPIDGVLVEANARAGEQVDPSRLLFMVVDARVVWIEARVFAGDIAAVESGTEAQVGVEAYPDKLFAAKLFFASPVVDEVSRTIRVLFEAQNPEGKLRPGMFATASIGAGGSEPSLAVPEQAVVEQAGRTRVYVHTAPERFEAREVVLGGRDSGFRAVRRGLQPGERVVVRGVFQVQSAAGD